jgi:hypothetical protein
MVLLSGVISVVAGVIILDIDWTVSDLAIFVGAYLIFRGLVQMFNGLLGRGLWAYYLGTGALSVLAGIVVIAWPGPTLLVIAILIGVSIVRHPERRWCHRQPRAGAVLVGRVGAGDTRDPPWLLVASSAGPDARRRHHRDRSLGIVRRYHAGRGVVRDPTPARDPELQVEAGLVSRCVVASDRRPSATRTLAPSLR